MSTSMNTTEPAVSEKFPEGFGDFALKSSDGIVCYFPSAFLSFMSPVFRDMFSLGKGIRNEGGSRDELLQITEPIAILELFLTHLNPKIFKPPIDKDTIESLLAMAHKYQVDTIMQWFDLEATTQRCGKGIKPLNEYAIAHPFLALSLASRYNLAHTARVASWELSGCHLNKLLDGAPSLSLPAYLKICRLRDVRIKRYHGWIDILTRPRPYSNYPPRQESHNKFMINGTWHVACLECSAKRIAWVVEVIKAVQLEPSWTGFIGAFEANSKHCFAWSDFFRDMIPTWKEEAIKEESKLPNWPIGDF